MGLLGILAGLAIAFRGWSILLTLLAVCGASHRESYFDIVMVGILNAVLALVAVIGLGTALGSF